MSGSRLLTIGHSSRSQSEFLELVLAHGIEHVVDIRRFPTSQRHPHFARDELRLSLASHGIRYRHEEALGGHREPDSSSRNLGLAEPAFRGYADHTASKEFFAAVGRVLGEARVARIVLLCAEARPAACHRSILADWLVAYGHAVEHILSADEREPHVLDACVTREERGGVVWRARQGLLFG